MISAKLGGTQFSVPQARRLLLLLHGDQHELIVRKATDTFGEAAIKAALAFDNKYARQAQNCEFFFNLKLFKIAYFLNSDLTDRINKNKSGVILED